MYLSFTFPKIYSTLKIMILLLILVEV